MTDLPVVDEIDLRVPIFRAGGTDTRPQILLYRYVVPDLLASIC